MFVDPWQSPETCMTSAANAEQRRGRFGAMDRGPNLCVGSCTLFRLLHIVRCALHGMSWWTKIVIGCYGLVRPCISHERLESQYSKN